MFRTLHPSTDYYVQQWADEAVMINAIVPYMVQTPIFIPYDFSEAIMPVLTINDVDALRLKFYRTNAAPVAGSAQGSAVYIVKDADNASRARLYATSSDGSQIREVSGLSETEVNALVDSKLLAHKELQYVTDIAARDALVLDRDMLVLVNDATGDATVNAGAAYYYYTAANDTWSKIAEFEGMDLTINWTDIQGRPAVTAAQIEEAVLKMHEHANKDVLDAISLDSEGFAVIGNVSYRNPYLAAPSEW